VLAEDLDQNRDPSGETSAPRPIDRAAHTEHLGRGVTFHNDLIFLDTGFSMSPEGGDVDAAQPGTLESYIPAGSESLVADHADPAADASPHSATALDAEVAARESAAYHQDIPEGPDFDVTSHEVETRDSGIITAESAAPRRSAAPAVEPHPATDIHDLEASLRRLESESRWPDALGVAAQLIAAEPSVIARYQKRVELAYFSGEREVLIQSYLDLAGALARAGNANQAGLVYRRVLAHEADNPAAKAGLTEILSNSRSKAPEPDFIDLGALILEEPKNTRGDTRIRVEEKPVDDDEDRVFQEALADFKRGVEARLAPDDFEAHYDLGIAFKEMGLVDEAIAQFQKALRAPNGPRLKAAEQLGIAFYEQGQFGIAEVVLRRATAGGDAAEEEKLGVLYWLGRVLESQGRNGEALPLYEQAAALDIRFLDVRERVKRLGEQRG
jgi:tetratricopeptide (TPR) repeat protein